MSVGTLSLCTGSYSLTKTSSYCSPAFDCKIRIYLCPNLSFAALFQVEYSSYDSLVWHIRVIYLVVLIEHIVNWNIQTRLSGERPRIHGVRLSVAYSTAAYIRRAPVHLIHQRSCLGPFRGQQYTRSNLTSELSRIRQKSSIIGRT